MPYQIHFIGIVCVIRQSNTAGLIALVDGRKYYDPCSQKTLATHLPYLIIPKTKLQSSQVPGRVIRDCFVIDLENITSITFPAFESVGTLNWDDPFGTAVPNSAKGYLWSEIDPPPSFEINVSAPPNTILQIPFQRGVFAVTRIKSQSPLPDPNRAHISQVEIQSLASPLRIVIDGTFAVEAAVDTDFVIANVTPAWIKDTTAPEAAEDFHLYYRLSRKPFSGCKQPVLKQPPNTTSGHPYLQDGRGLQIACSPTYYG